MPRLSGSAWARVVDRAARLLHRVLEHLQDLERLDARVVDAVALDQIAVVVDRVADSCTAIDEATSPAAWPPMPSATMNSRSFLSMRKLSSLCVALPPDVGRCRERQLHPRASYYDGRLRCAGVHPARREPARCELGLDEELERGRGR